jgi:hypothetical protein
MKLILSTIFLTILIASCNGRRKTKDVIKSNNIKCLDTINLQSRFIDSIRKSIIEANKKLTNSDTLKYSFNIEDVGTEGNEGVAYYYKNDLVKIIFEIYTSMGKIRLSYKFNQANVFVKEENFSKSNEEDYKNLVLTKAISYMVDRNGLPLQKVDPDRINIYQELIDNIPFSLNK